MEHSHILLYFLVIITMVFIASANDSRYKILRYGEKFPAYPWQRVDHRKMILHFQTRAQDNKDTFGQYDYNIHKPPTLPNGTLKLMEKKSNFEEKMAELNNFGRGSGVKVIYGRVPVPVTLLTSYDEPNH